jgi:hypothetical protein
VLALAACSLVGCLVLAALVAQAVHTSIDPTERSFTVTLYNSTSQTVVLKQCGARCTSFHDNVRLSPGGSESVNTSSDGAANWWAVTDASGRVLGCLPLTYDHKSTRVVVDVASRSECP